MGPYYINVLMHWNCLGTTSVPYNLCILHNALVDVGLYAL